MDLLFQNWWCHSQWQCLQSWEGPSWNSQLSQHPILPKSITTNLELYKIHNRNIEIKHILRDPICLLHNETQLILTKSIPFLNNKILLQSALHTKKKYMCTSVLNYNNINKDHQKLATFNNNKYKSKRQISISNIPKPTHCSSNV